MQYHVILDRVITAVLSLALAISPAQNVTHLSVQGSAQFDPQRIHPSVDVRPPLVYHKW